MSASTNSPVANRDWTLGLAALTATLRLAAASRVVAVRQMNGMDMGVATRLGSFAFFVALWVSMMAAMVLYRPHGSFAAGVVAIAAGAYELTPLKQHFRWRCRESVRSGFQFGLSCVGSSIGLMLLLALAIVGLGVLIATSPSSVPGLTPPM